jgi:hypothetical protein
VFFVGLVDIALLKVSSERDVTTDSGGLGERL